MNVCFQVRVNRDPLPGDHAVISKNPNELRNDVIILSSKMFECHVIL